MPRRLREEQLLGLSPFGAWPRLEPARVAGPKLMWGRMLAATGPAGTHANPVMRAMSAMWRSAARHAPFYLAVWLAMIALFAFPAVAQDGPLSIKPSFIEPVDSPEDVTSTIELMLLLTLLTMAPSILMMTTAFTRIIIVFGFLRMALSTQQLPPTQVLTGLALILTFMIMSPTIMEIKNKAVVPYLDAQITQKEAFDVSLNSMRNFMFAQVARKDLIMFGELSAGKDEAKSPQHWKTYGDIDTLVLIPAFVTSELKRGFFMGFMLYLPFLVIDLIVATVLISMGMLVLPPVLISLPFKILLFVLVDGWTLVVTSLFKSFVPVATESG
jgi:flagellar biosynthetic protein FliP